QIGEQEGAVGGGDRLAREAAAGVLDGDEATRQHAAGGVRDGSRNLTGQSLGPADAGEPEDRDRKRARDADEAMADGHSPPLPNAVTARAHRSRDSLWFPHAT